ncbi:MAG TPA: hypothetical protein VFB66_16690 [Tepidisphaeraceae bacterium]|nr:hypothetical protein [Tepidisphaeraceae bacterium]
MVALFCVVACAIAHDPFGPAQVLSPAATTPDGTVRFAHRSEWFAERFTMRPPAPDGDDLITFTDPWGNRGGMNACVAGAYWGTPRVRVDHALREVRIEFTGGEFSYPISRVCPTNVTDTRGLIGSFGPLSPGQWTYRTPYEAPVTFTVVPEPSAVAALAFPIGLLVLRRHVRGGNTEVGNPVRNSSAPCTSMG